MVKIEEVKGFALRMPEREINHDEGISLTMNRRDVVIFHDLLQHASHLNPARAERWALIPTYRCAAEVDSATIWKHPFLASGRSVNGAKPKVKADCVQGSDW